MYIWFGMGSQYLLDMWGPDTTATFRKVFPKTALFYLSTWVISKLEVAIVSVGINFPCDSEVKYAGFLPCNKTLHSLVKNAKSLF